MHVTVGLSVDSENIFLVKTDTVVYFCQQNKEQFIKMNTKNQPFRY